MRVLFCLVSLFFTITSCFADNTIKALTIKQIIEDGRYRPDKVYVFGTVRHIEYETETTDLFAEKAEKKVITNFEIFDGDYVAQPSVGSLDVGTVKNGDNIVLYSYANHDGSSTKSLALQNGRITEGSTLFKNNFEVIPWDGKKITLPDSFSVEEYFNMNYIFGKKVVKLTGKVKESRYINRFIGKMMIELSAKEGDVTGEYPKDAWIDDPEKKIMLKKIIPGSNVTFIGSVQRIDSSSAIFLIKDIILHSVNNTRCSN